MSDTTAVAGMAQRAQSSIRQRASRVLPGGTFGNVSGNLVIARGSGSRVWDDEGREYIDYLIGSGSMIVGHAHPEVTRAVRRQIETGTTFFASNPEGIALAEAIIDAVPVAEKVRFTSTGAEADAFAMRLARAHTGRPKILKFEGGYHGYSDYGLMSLAPKTAGNSPRPIPDSAGIPDVVRDTILVAPFNDAGAVESLLGEHRSEIAAVFLEPMQRLIPPQPGFLAALRELTREHDVLLVFDEVVTGFRLGMGGAQEYYGVVPDLCTLGKVIGGGFPLAAIAGRDDIMAAFDSDRAGTGRFVPQVGTLSGNPVAAVAGLATLDVLSRPGAFDRLFDTGRRLMAALEGILAANGIDARVVGEPPLFDVVFTHGAVNNHRDMLTGNAAMLKRFNALLGESGVLKADSKIYVSMAINDEDITRTIAAMEDAISRLARERDAGLLP